MNESKDLYDMCFQPLKVFVFDDTDPEQASYIGIADIPLIPLAHNKAVKGLFELKAANGRVSGTIELEMRWQFTYVPPKGLPLTEKVRTCCNLFICCALRNGQCITMILNHTPTQDIKPEKPSTMNLFVKTWIYWYFYTLHIDVLLILTSWCLLTSLQPKMSNLRNHPPWVRPFLLHLPLKREWRPSSLDLQLPPPPCQSPESQMMPWRDSPSPWILKQLQK